MTISARDFVNQPLSSAERAGLLATLRDARALVLRDAEGFHEAASVLEYLGQVLCGAIRNGLNWYRAEILQLATGASPIHQRRVEALFETVRKARNDAVHTGAYIRHHAGHLVELILVLEEALMADMVEVQDLMVRNPVCAELWENVATARRKMLSESFSFLPVEVRKGEWRLLSDRAMVNYFAGANSKKERDTLLGKPILEAERCGLRFETCRQYAPSTPITDVIKDITQSPALIVQQSALELRLVGIVTCFDLL